jgi:hypothetical protein
MTEDPNVYVACDYSATGEGRSIMILITRANVRRDLGDYEVEPSFDENGYNPGVLKTTAEQRAMREFSEKFSSYFAMGAEVLDRNEFFHRYENHVPAYVYKLTDVNGEHIPPGFNFYTSIHFNYS